MMKFKRNLFLTGIVLAAAALVIAAGFTTAEAAKAQKAVILATTTSTQDSGLLDVLIPMFEKKTGYFVKTIAVGSGQAMAMGPHPHYSSVRHEKARSKNGTGDTLHWWRTGSSHRS